MTKNLILSVTTVAFLIGLTVIRAQTSSPTTTQGTTNDTPSTVKPGEPEKSPTHHYKKGKSNRGNQPGTSGSSEGQNPSSTGNTTNQ